MKPIVLPIVLSLGVATVLFLTKPKKEEGKKEEKKKEDVTSTTSAAEKVAVAAHKAALLKAFDALSGQPVNDPNMNRALFEATAEDLRNNDLPDKAAILTAHVQINRSLYPLGTAPTTPSGSDAAHATRARELIAKAAIAERGGGPSITKPEAQEMGGLLLILRGIGTYPAEVTQLEGWTQIFQGRFAPNTQLIDECNALYNSAVDNHITANVPAMIDCADRLSRAGLSATAMLDLVNRILVERSRSTPHGGTTSTF